MGTTNNCYDILNDVRIGINEWTPSLVQGADTTGVFPNSYLINQINKAQYYIWNILFQDVPEYFLTSKTFTFTASVGTIPADCHKIKRLEDSDGHKIDLISVDISAKETSGGSPHQYYRYGNTVKLDGEQSGTYTLWYYKRCIDITTGMSSAGGALSLTLATTARKETDYYNDATIENITGDWTDTISAYSSSRVCTLAAQTGAASQYYGTVSSLPELFQSLIADQAIILVKRSPLSTLRVTREDIETFNVMLNESIRSFAGTANSDTDINDIFCDF